VVLLIFIDTVPPCCTVCKNYYRPNFVTLSPIGETGNFVTLSAAQGNFVTPEAELPGNCIQFDHQIAVFSLALNTAMFP